MTSGRSIDVSRMIRLASVLLAVSMGAGISIAEQPVVDALDRQLDDARFEIASDDAMFAEERHLRLRRDELRRTYATAFSRNAESTFLLDLDAISRRYDVAVVATTTDSNHASDAVESTGLLRRIGLTLGLRGTYRQLVDVIAALSQTRAIARVSEPNLRRDGDALAATVSISLFQPTVRPERVSDDGTLR